MVEVQAHITGIVWKIECKVGDVIEEGDTVITLESMKMEMPVEPRIRASSRRSSASRVSPWTRATSWSSSTDAGSDASTARAHS